MRYRKLLFILPNLFTVTSIFFGFYALSLCAAPEAGPVQLYQAALAIFFAIFFDGFDGRVARLTKTQSEFGMELDSLADVVSFGVAPALLVYKWALAPLGFWGLLLSFCFAACGALRLARFNVLARRSPHAGGGSFFVGLPIPVGAGILVSMIIAHHHAMHGELPGAEARLPIAVGVLGLSLLMVSTLRYRTFKDVRLSRRSALALMLMGATALFIATHLHPAYVLVACSATYLTLGFVESAFHVRNRLVARRVGTAMAVAVVAEGDEEEDEDELEAGGQR